MEPMLMPEIDLDSATVEEVRVRDWQVEQLLYLGLPTAAAETVAGLVDWHELTDLVRRGCSSELALEIAR